jgi:cell division protein FtsI/penicillin-binding protein 2
MRDGTAPAADPPAARHHAAAPKRALWVGAVWMALLTLILLALLGRVAQLQTNPPEPIAQRVDTQQIQRKLLARRGPLCDRRGRVLAASRLAHRLFVDPKLIDNRLTFEERVARAMDYNPIRLEKKLHGRSQDRYVVIDRRLSDKKLSAFHQLEEPGLATKPIVVRDYPQGDLAGPIIGFVGEEGHGLEGVEAVYDDKLIGAPGQYRLVRNSRRQPLWMRQHTYQKPRDGRAVHLALDAMIQRIAENQLHQAVEHYKADSGMLVVLAPRTGEILAMANAPHYNPNQFADAPSAHRRNRCVTDVFEPGSIFKPVAWAGLTELGAAHPTETIDTTDKGYWVTDFGRTLRDAHGIGPVTWEKVLVLSSNIGMGKVAMRKDKQALHKIVQAFGFGTSTGSGLPGEVKGLVNPLSQWNEYSQTSIPMGQEIGVTALQMTRAFAVFANGGWLLKPSITPIQSIDQRNVVRRVLPQTTADQTRQVMRRVVTEGTGRKAKSKHYRLFGKTGTAQLPDFENGGYYDDQYMASFVAGAPLNNPRLVVGCFIRKPNPEVGHYGGIVSAPVVKRVIEKSLQYLGVPPRDDTDAQIARQN